MAINRGYVPNHKFYDEMGRITPNVEWSESDRPHFEAQVASWLPVVRYERELNSWFVVSSGKIISVDRERNLCLAGYKKLWQVGEASALIYTANDYSAQTIDLTTGVAYAVNGTTTYSEAQVTAALKLRGLIKSTERAMDFISHPVGFASYNYYQAAGTDVRNPASYKFHNFKPQELAAITCDYVMIAPVTPAVVTTETMDTDNTDGASSDLSTNGFGTGGWYNSTQINAMTRYSSDVAAGDNLVCYVFEKFPVAHNTASTPVTCSVTSGLVSQKSVITDVTAAGDYFIDHEVGALFLYEADGNAIPTGFSTSSTITYYSYETVVEAARTSSYFCATGDINVGDFLTYDTNSNLIKAVIDIGTTIGYTADGAAYSADPDYDTATDAAISLQLEQAVAHYVGGIVGQVLNVIEYPRDYLDRVRTAFVGATSPSSLTGMNSTAVMQTPGSATGGRSDQLTYTNSAEKLLIVNFIHR